MPSDAVARVAALMRPYRGWWAIAGGWATDTWLGEVTREHHDIEISCARAEAAALWDFLADASLHARMRQIDPPGTGWRPWARGATPGAPAFQLQTQIDDLTFDMFLEDVSSVGNVALSRWTFRRDRRIARPLAEVTALVGDVPVLIPDIQLLYMAKSNDPKNEADFRRIAPMLTADRRAWLLDALCLVDPEHRWIAALTSPQHPGGDACNE
jgi:hypothetical protein